MVSVGIFAKLVCSSEFCVFAPCILMQLYCIKQLKYQFGKGAFCLFISYNYIIMHDANNIKLYNYKT